MIYLKDNSSYVSKIYPKNSNNHGPADMERIFGRKDNDLKLVADIERRRDRVVLEILIEAAGLDRKYRKVASEGEILGLSVEGGDDVVNLFQQDNLSADAITLVRQNQALLCNFLIHHLQRDSHHEQHTRHEILMWCMLFLLHSATKLFCAPEHVVDVILKFAESFNMHLKSFCYQSKEGNPQLNHFKLHEVQHCWILLQNTMNQNPKKYMVDEHNHDNLNSVKSTEYFMWFSYYVPNIQMSKLIQQNYLEKPWNRLY